MESEQNGDGIKVDMTTGGRSSKGAWQIKVLMDQLVPEGLTATNWSIWLSNLEDAMTDADTDVYDLFVRKTRVGDVKDPHALARSRGKLRLIYKTILGDHAELIEDVAAEDVFDTLRRELGGAVTTSEKMQLMNELFTLRYDPVKEDFPSHYRRFKAVVREINRKVKATRVAHGLPHSFVPAITDDLACDFFVQTLVETLKEDTFTKLDGEHRVDIIYTKLLSLINNRASAAAAESAFAARSVPATPPASISAPHVPRTPNARPKIQASAMRTPTPGKRTPGLRYRAPISAIEVPNAARWKGGLLKRRNGIYQFRAPRDACFRCWKIDGHRVSECQMTDAEGQVARSKALAECGIHVAPEALALVADFGLAAEGYKVSRALFEHDAPNSEYFANGNGPGAYLVDADDQGLSRAGALCTEAHEIISTLDDGRYLDEADAFTVSVPFTQPTKEGARTWVTLTALHTSVPKPAVAFATGTRRFLFDTGASVHLTCDKTVLKDFRPLGPHEQLRVAGAFGSSGLAEGVGALTGEFDVDGRKAQITFEQVYYVPSLGHNLISGFQLFAAGFGLSTRDKALEISPLGSKLVIARMPLDLSTGSIPVPVRWLSPMPLTADADALVTVDATTWHQQLGHTSAQRMRKAEKQGSVAGIVWNHTQSLFPCEDCVSGKSVRLPVSQHARHRACAPLERVHTDVWGKAPIPGRQNREQYAVSLVDDYSRMIFIDGIVTRAAVPDVIKAKVTQLELQVGARVKRFRRDGALEYRSRALNDFLLQKGIVAEDTVPYEHQQNGVAERPWRTLFDMARTMMITAKLPQQFWLLAVKAAAHIHNRLPNRANPGQKSPYELFYGTAPSLSHVRAFGCVAHALIDATRRSSKLAPRTRRCHLVGYLEDAKGYLLYDPASKSFLHAVQVRFFEDRFVDARWSDDEARQMAGWWLSAPGEEEMVVQAPGQTPGGEKQAPSQEEQQQATGHDEQQQAAGHDEQQQATGHAEQQQAPAQEEQQQAAAPDRQEQVAADKPAEVRRSRRGDGKVPEHYVPIAGSPEQAGERIQAALVTIAQRPKAYFLAHASLDDNLRDEDPDVTRVCEIDPTAPIDLCLTMIDQDLDKPNVRQALRGADEPKWRAAMALELEAFRARNVYDASLVDLPPGARAIPLKWVLLIKRDEHGNVIKYKARLVARGDLQREGLDYNETFSSTVRFSTVLTLIALSTARGWDAKQFDVSEAFLHGKLPSKPELYISQIPGYEDPSRRRMAHRLNKSLYGLRQAGRLWNETFVDKLRGLGFSQCASDSSLFVRRRSGKVAIIPIHVDDGLVVGDDDLGQVIRELSATLDDSVREEPLSLFLGVKISRGHDGAVTLDQRHYVAKMLDRFGFDAAPRPYSTPMSAKADLRPFVDGEDEPGDRRYRELLGALLYAAISTRPDISYAVGVLSRFAARPADRHWAMLKRVLRYLHATADLGLSYSRDGDHTLVGFSDSDHADDPATRRSVSGWVFKLAGCAISWRSKRQPTVSVSTTEAEYIALSSAAREAIWLRSLLSDLGAAVSGPTTLFGNNKSAITLAHHPSVHHRTKHIAVHAHFTRERVQMGELEVEWVSTNEMAADGLTKALAGLLHERMVGMMGLRPIAARRSVEQRG